MTSGLINPARIGRAFGTCFECRLVARHRFVVVMLSSHTAFRNLIGSDEYSIIKNRVVPHLRSESSPDYSAEEAVLSALSMGSVILWFNRL